MTRDNLYKMLKPGGRPSFAAIDSLLKVFEIDMLEAVRKAYPLEGLKGRDKRLHALEEEGRVARLSSLLVARTRAQAKTRNASTAEGLE